MKRLQMQGSTVQTALCRCSVIPRVIECFTVCGNVVTFCVSRRRHEMYGGHGRLCVSLSVCVSVYLSVCVSLATFPHYCPHPDVTWGNVRGCPLVMQNVSECLYSLCAFFHSDR